MTLIIALKHWKKGRGLGILLNFVLTTLSIREKDGKEKLYDVKKTAGFRRTLFLTRVPKKTGRFLMRQLADLYI